MTRRVSVGGRTRISLWDPVVDRFASFFCLWICYLLGLRPQVDITVRDLGTHGGNGATPKHILFGGIAESAHRPFFAILSRITNLFLFTVIEILCPTTGIHEGTGQTTRLYHVRVHRGTLYGTLIIVFQPHLVIAIRCTDPWPQPLRHRRGSSPHPNGHAFERCPQ